MPLQFNPVTGTLDLVNPASSPGGSNTQIQFNDGGVFGGDADFVWTPTKYLQIGGYPAGLDLHSFLKATFYNDDPTLGFGYATMVFGSKAVSGYSGSSLIYGFESTSNTWAYLYETGAEINNEADISTRDYFFFDKVANKYKIAINGDGDIGFGTFGNASTLAGAALVIKSSGNVGIGQTTPTAALHLKAGTATASTAPIKLTSGTRLTTSEPGVHEYNGNHLLTNDNIRFPVGGVLFDHYADVGNVGTGEDNLYSDTLVASTLAVNGDKVTATYQGIFSGAVASTQELRVYFGGTKIYDSGALAIGVATNNWTLSVSVIRESSSVVRCSVEVSTDFATLFPYSTYTRITGLTLTNTQILKLTGEATGAGAANDQIVSKLGYIEFKPGV